MSLIDAPSTPAQFADRLRHYAEATASFISQGPTPTTLLTEMEGNVGDHLIWRGTRRMLDQHGVSYIELALDELTGRSRAMTGGTLVVPGGGAFGVRWHERLAAAVTAAANAFKRVVVLPSSYDPEVDVVAGTLALDNVYPIAREPQSYRKIRRFGRAGLALDPALYALDFRGFDPSQGHGVLVALRTDQGSQLPGMILSPNPEVNDDISLTSHSLDDFLVRVEGCNEVVTDRLHVAVATPMLGRRPRLIDPYDHKISRYLAFVFRGALDDRLSQHDEGWLADRNYVVKAGV